MHPWTVKACKRFECGIYLEMASLVSHYTLPTLVSTHPQEEDEEREGPEHDPAQKESENGEHADGPIFIRTIHMKMH